MPEYYQGKYRPKNPHKYKGNPNEIYFRSSWEAKAMMYFDLREEVIQWSSEEIIVPYRSKLDGKKHRYFPDFVITVIDKNGKKKTYMVEVKPYKQTIEPKPQKRITKKYLREVQTYVINKSKWEYAEEFCKDRGWEFTTITEKDLFGSAGINL